MAGILALQGVKADLWAEHLDSVLWEHVSQIMLCDQCFPVLRFTTIQLPFYR